MDDLGKIQRLLSKTESTLFEAPALLIQLHQEQEGRILTQTRNKRRERGERTYKDALGDKVGGTLHKAVANEVTEEKLAEHADSLVETGLKGLSDQMKSLGDNVSDDDCDKLADALVAQFGDVGSAFLEGDGKGIVDNVQELINDNPEVIAGAAVLAGIAAVVANMEIPELATKLGIAEGLSVEMGVKLGKIRDIALEKVQARLVYANKIIETSLSLAVNDPLSNSKVESVLDVRYRPDDKLSIYGQGKVSEIDGVSIGLGADYQVKKDLSIGVNAELTEDDAKVGVGVTWKF